MAVFVDELVDSPHAPRPFAGGFCHMMADSRVELLGMAKRIGLKAHWIQHERTELEHFDLSASARARAVAAGAIEMSSRDMLRRARGRIS